MKAKINDLIKFKGYTTDFLYGVVKTVKQTEQGNVYICHYPNNPQSNVMVVMEQNIIEVYI